MRRPAKKVEKLVADGHFRDLLEMVLPALNMSQLDRLWEALRLEVRRRYFNQGLTSALRAVDEYAESDATWIEALSSGVAGVKKAIELKTWKNAEPKKGSKK